MKNMTTIRNAVPQDIPLIQELTNIIWPLTYYPIIGEAQVAYMLGLFYTHDALIQQMQNGHQFILAFYDKTPVAFASYSLIGPNIYKLQKLYILPNQQGKGIGQQMVNHICAAIKELHATHLRLNVNIHNTGAIAFYKKVGFYQFREEDIDIGGGYYMNDYVLEKAL